MDILVDDEYSGKCVYDLLRRKLGVSTKLLARLKRDEHGIIVNGKRVNVRFILHNNDLLSISDYADESGTYITPQPLPISIVYEDEYLIVADKPPFMPTHPSHDHYDDTLANALAYRCRDASEPFVFRPVSRLDRNTSGLVTVAKTKYAAAKLNTLMMSGGFHKVYTAVLDGALPSVSGDINECLHRTAKSIIVREVCQPDTPDAETALTRYEVIYSNKINSIVRSFPQTGRTHQIRVHFSYCGTPITGDDLYGNKSSLISRHALHATALSFIHPINGKAIELYSPLPDDITKLILELFGELPGQIKENIYK